MRSDKTSKRKEETSRLTDANDYLRLHRSQELRENIQNISHLLNTGLSPETLDICIKICEAGVQPDSLADAVNTFRNEMSRMEEEER